jgi:hypothetical protein
MVGAQGAQNLGAEKNRIAEVRANSSTSRSLISRCTVHLTTEIFDTDERGRTRIFGYRDTDEREGADI